MESSIGGETQSTNTHSQYQEAISSYMSSIIDNQDERQKRAQKIRENVTKKERE